MSPLNRLLPSLAAPMRSGSWLAAMPVNCGTTTGSARLAGAGGISAGFGNVASSDFALLQRRHEVVGSLGDVPVPLRGTSAEIVADANLAVLAGDDAKPGGGVVLASGGNPVAALGTQVGERGVVPAPGRGREQADDFGVAPAGRGTPALQQHFVDGLERGEVAFQRERPVREAGEAAIGSDRR